MLIRKCNMCGKTNRHSSNIAVRCMSCATREWVDNNREKVIKYRKDKKKDMKENVLLFLSNNDLKCACCGERERVFLCLDHIHKDGNIHRQKVGKHNGQIYKDIYRKIRSGEEVKLSYRVLCANCNLAFLVLGYCPHHKP